jgi:hypothetical protein
VKTVSLKLAFHILIVTYYLSFLDIAKVVNISLNLDVNFEKEILEGFVILTIQKVDPAATEVVSCLLPLTTVMKFNLYSGESTGTANSLQGFVKIFKLAIF